MNNYIIKLKTERLYILLFILIIILNQFLKDELNSITGSNILNYNILPLIVILYLIIRKKELKTNNIIIIIIITGIYFLNYNFNKYEIERFIRGLFTFILPLYIFIIPANDVNMKFVIRKCCSIMNILIYISFVYSVFLVLSNNINFMEDMRTGSIIGHPLTAAWYYVIFLSLNFISCKYIAKKKDIFILINIVISVIGTTLAAGRIGLLFSIILGIYYAYSCIESKVIKYILIPIFFIAFIFTPIVNDIIWQKFRDTISVGDISNGRLWAIREMSFYSIKPFVFKGGGIGYSNYISNYVLGTFNFENPILMFAFDYGISTVIILVILTIIIPVIKFSNKREHIILFNFICMCIIPYTYNGLAESTGLFMILVYLQYIYLQFSNNL